MMAAALPLLQTLCHGCLSADRDLSPIGEFITTYKTICDIKTASGIKDTNFCWECTATLKRMLLFYKQVDNAQTILKFYAQTKELQKPLPKSLSKLETTRANHDFISLIHLDEPEPEESTPDITDEFKPDVKPLDKIKQDINDDEDFENTDLIDANNDFTYLEEINSEDPTLVIKITKIKTENKKHASQKKKPKKPRLNYTRIKTAEKMCVKEQARPDDFNVLPEGYKCKAKDSDCSICNKEKDDENIDTHNSNYHDKLTGSHVCRICHTRYPTLDELQSHETSHVIYRCLVCGHRSPSVAAAGRHVAQHGEMFKCRLCEFCSRRRPDFFMHYRASHKKYRCDYCGKIHRSKLKLERHITRTHMEIKCGVCGLRCKSFCRLRHHHVAVHEVDQSEASFCVKCNMQFKNIYRYRCHLSSAAAHAQEMPHKAPSKQPVKCPACDKRYMRHTYMMNHYRHVHMAKTKHYCCDCDRFFLNRTSFLRHRAGHEGVEKKKDKLCSVCGRGFTTNQILRHHMSTHTGDRPYACAVCDARFAQKTARDVHQKRHSAQKNVIGLEY